MSELKLWERVRKCELAIQKVCIDLAAIGEELRTAVEPQVAQCEICKALDEDMEYSNERP